MAYSSSSVAYDLPVYEQPRQKPELRAVRSPRRMITAATFSPQVLCSFLIIVALTSFMVYNQVKLNEISGEINLLNAQLKELESENVKMNSELESAVNLRTIGDQAKNELGMQRLEQYQTEYIYLHHEDKIELTGASPSAPLGTQIRMSVTSVISRLKEYIAGR